jgi:hypothetical protein
MDEELGRVSGVRMLFDEIANTVDGNLIIDEFWHVEEGWFSLQKGPLMVPLRRIRSVCIIGERTDTEHKAPSYVRVDVGDRALRVASARVVEARR